MRGMQRCGDTTHSVRDGERLARIEEHDTGPCQPNENATAKDARRGDIPHRIPTTTTQTISSAIARHAAAAAHRHRGVHSLHVGLVHQNFSRLCTQHLHLALLQELAAPKLLYLTV
jgi:hypothetical protein